ncbi:unnamed protein product [Hymenolepis diminuta]|uniref:FGGY_N domain-containing protein n=1 Tax=Hymenolepis diminuta TaxID=6216 RepID=A0A0R3SYC9_HYMDI|nr:unnamed protein product [Hymenolepis diminuta]
MISDENSPRNLIMAVDFGSTHAFARIYDEKWESLAESTMPSKTNDPEICWTLMCNLIKAVLKRACVRPTDLNCLGISVQRNSFLLWNRETSRPSLNKSGKLLYKVAPTPKFKMASHYQLTCMFSVTRLAHMFQEDPTLYEKCRKGELVYGCLETWLLWRLTGGRAWCTDVSCISATGAFDPSIVS